MISVVDVNYYCDQLRRKFHNIVIDETVTERSLKNSFDLYWAVPLFHETHRTETMSRLDFLKLSSNKVLLESYYRQFREIHSICNCLHCKLRNDCLQLMLQRGVAPLVNVDFNKYIYKNKPIDYFELYHHHTDIKCDAIYRKNFINLF